jgi:hypothetical protein
MLVVASTETVLIAGTIGLAFVLFGITWLWPWLSHSSSISRARKDWLEAEAEIVDYRLIPSTETQDWYAVYRFEASRDRRVEGITHSDRRLTKRGEVGVRCTVLYNPNDAREFRTLRTERDVGQAAFGALFLIIGLAIWVLPLIFLDRLSAD